MAMVTIEVVGKTSIAKILNDKGGEDIEVSFDEGADYLFIRQERDDGVDVIALTPLQVMYLKRILELSIEDDEEDDGDLKQGLLQ